MSRVPAASGLALQHEARPPNVSVCSPPAGQSRSVEMAQRPTDGRGAPPPPHTHPPALPASARGPTRLPSSPRGRREAGSRGCRAPPGRNAASDALPRASRPCRRRRRRGWMWLARSHEDSQQSPPTRLREPRAFHVGGAVLGISVRLRRTVRLVRRGRRAKDLRGHDRLRTR